MPAATPCHPAPAPPLAQGVAASRVYLPATCRHRLLLDYLAEHFAHVSQEEWAQRMAAGTVLDAAHRPLPPDAAFVPHALVWYYREVKAEPAIPFTEKVLFQDAWLVVADKPHFLPVTPGGRHARETLLARLQHTLGLPELAPIHRIDRETAGLVAFAVQPATRNAYMHLFRTGQVQKTYQAIAHDNADLALPRLHTSRLAEHPQDFFRMAEHAGSPNSRTVIARQHRLPGGLVRLQLTPQTGKRHQLRVHLAALGMPIVGDQLYPQVLRGPHEAEDFAQPLQLLAHTLAFTDPVTGQHRHFTSERQLLYA